MSKKNNWSDNLEIIGQCVDTLENLEYSDLLNIPLQIKHEATMDSIKEIKEKIKNALIKETGFNPWED